MDVDAYRIPRQSRERSWRRPGKVEGRTGCPDSRPVGFDDPDFSQLCLLIHDVRALRGGDWSVLGRVLRALVHVSPLLRAVARLPTDNLYLSDRAAGRRIRSRLPHGALSARRIVAISTLTLPSTFEEYRRGRCRQALRTNCSRAVRAGVRVGPLEDPELVRERMLEVFERRDEPYSQAWHVGRAESGEGEFWFALDAAGRTLAFAEVIVDLETAMLSSMIGARRPGSSDARYLLTAEVVRSLAARGIRQLVVNRAFSLSPGLVYFQKLLGFSPKNLEVLTPQTSVRPVSRKVTARARAFRPVGPPR
jgi:hypothetical protein